VGQSHAAGLGSFDNKLKSLDQVEPPCRRDSAVQDTSNATERPAIGEVMGTLAAPGRRPLLTTASVTYSTLTSVPMPERREWEREVASKGVAPLASGCRQPAQSLRDSRP
jgi:hypothetical protein